MKKILQNEMIMNIAAKLETSYLKEIYDSFDSFDHKKEYIKHAINDYFIKEKMENNNKIPSLEKIGISFEELVDEVSELLFK